MADGYSWLVGFSSIVHRYECRREIVTRRRATVDLAGVENRGARNHHLRRSRRRAPPRARGELRRALHPFRRCPAPASISARSCSRGFDAKMPSGHENRFLPSAALLARPIEGLTLYARYQQGFRPGGLSIAGDTVRLYRNDRLGTAEAGSATAGPAAIASTCKAAPRSAAGRISRRISSIHPGCRSPTISATGGSGRSPSTAASG